MEALWTRRQASIREVHGGFPKKNRPAYTAVQTTVYRLEAKKKAVRRVKKVGNSHIFEAAITRDAAQRRLIDDLLALFGGRIQRVMSRLVESGKLTLQDVRERRRLFKSLRERIDHNDPQIFLRDVHGHSSSAR